MAHKVYKVIHQETGRCIVDRCRKADSFVSRFFGLMGTTFLDANEALWIEPCHSVHSFFMRYAIDVIYIDSSGAVLDVVTNMVPWRMHLPRSSARAVLELSVGKAAQIKRGDHLCLS
jgi:uncharacterized membrane protein (UPF0127 family)